MKRHLVLMASSLAAVSLLAGCGETPSSSSSSPSGSYALKGVEMVVPDENFGPKRSGEKLQLLFKENGEVPYISLKDGFGLMAAVKALRAKDAKGDNYYFRLSKEGAKTVVVDEAGAKATFDPSAQTIVYDDFDSLLTLHPSSIKPLSILNVPADRKSVKVVDSSYKKGNSLTVDLKPYSAIEMVSYGEDLYLPVATFNDCFYNVYEYADLAYNFKDLYMIPNGSLKMELFGISSLTEFGESFYGATKKESLSEEVSRFHHQEACLNFDNFYGLKQEKGFSSFASFLETKGFKEDITGTDTKRVDAALRYGLSYLNDGHTAATGTSTLYAYGEGISEPSKYSPDRAAWEAYGEALEKERAKAGDNAKLGNYLDTASKCYYIGFDTFTAIDEDLLYMSTMSEDLPPETINGNTGLQFHDAYSFLTDEANKGKANTIVVDLLTNGGGSADSLIYSLCTLLGEVKTSMRNPYTGAENRTTFKADLNLDGKIDEKDVGLAQKGYNIVFLDSKATFSCGNAMPAIAKTNNAKVMTIGETSGGGACAVRPAVSALGATYSMSSTAQISVEKEGKLVNVESGVPADHAVTRENFFARDFLSAMVNTWFGQ